MKHFLVLEDNEDDAFLLRRAFSSLVGCTAHVCRNESEARAYLKGAGIYANRNRFPFPDAIISDLRVGEESGVDFLNWVRSQQELQSIDCTLPSASASPAELKQIEGTESLKVLHKPLEINSLRLLIRDLCASVEDARASADPLTIR